MKQPLPRVGAEDWLALLVAIASLMFWGGVIAVIVAFTWSLIKNFGH